MSECVHLGRCLQAENGAMFSSSFGGADAVADQSQVWSWKPRVPFELLPGWNKNGPLAMTRGKGIHTVDGCEIRFAPLGNHGFVRYLQGNPIIPGFLRWCDVDFATIHSMTVFKLRSLKLKPNLK